MDEEAKTEARERKTGTLINGGGHKVNIYIQGREASGPALQIPFEIIEGVFNAADADITKITERILVSCEAEVDAWAVLTFWALHDENPPSTSFEFNGGEIFVRAWNIGHKYGLAKFQDSMMGEMLWGLNDSAASMAARVSAFEGSAPGSVMRRLLAEDLAREIDGGDLTLAKLTELYTIPGFEAELLQALKQQHVHSNPEMRIPGEEENATGPWKKFMFDGLENKFYEALMRVKKEVPQWHVSYFEESEAGVEAPWKKSMVGEGPWKWEHQG